MSLKFLKFLFSESKRRKKYLKMDVADLKKLSHDDLKEALLYIIDAEEEKYGWNVDECLKQFSGAKRVYYIVNYFNMEVQNGGLCQFFVNSSREVAPYILESLRVIDALEYEKLLNDFIESNKIDLNNLESFIIEDVEDFEEQIQRYPFDDFDDEYYELFEKKSLEDILTKYAKLHLDDFAM